MDELDRFLADLLRVAPQVEQALRTQGSSVQPDLETPVAWLGDVGAALAELLTTLEPATQQAAFDVIEAHLVHGSRLMKDAVATGLLEMLASEVSGGRLSGPALGELLGPRSRAYLDAYDEFTLGRSTLDPS